MADLTITAANVGISGSGSNTRVVQVGEAVTQGQPGYLLTTDGKYYQTDADDTAAKAVAAGIFLTAASTDGYAVLAMPGSTINLGATLAVGTVYVLSGTKGGICPAADLATGDYTTILGVATTTSSLVLNFIVSGVQVPA